MSDQASINKTKNKHKFYTALIVLVILATLRVIFFPEHSSEKITATPEIKTEEPVLVQQKNNSTPKVSIKKEDYSKTDSNKIANAVYAKKVLSNVFPFITSAVADVKLGGTNGANLNFNESLLAFKDAQTELQKAQSGIDALKNDVPTDFININKTINDIILNYNQAVTLAIHALSDTTNPNVSEIKQAMTYATKGTLLMNQMTAEVEQLSKNVD